MDLEQLQADWERFGADDPLWAVYSRDDGKGGGWDVTEFFATGRAEVTRVLAEVDRLCPDRPRHAALDFGCGVGRLTQPLADHHDVVTGVDISGPMIEQARAFNQSGDRCRFVLNQAPDLAILDDASVDLVYSSIVLQHIPVDLGLGYVAEFARVLRPGGVATFTMPSEPAATLRGRLYRVLPFALINAYKRRRDGAVMAMHHVRRTRMEAHLRACGFEVLEAEQDTSGGPNWISYRYYAQRT